MTQDEIIEMAIQAGLFKDYGDGQGSWLANDKDLEAFAKLVAAKERKEMAEHCVEITRMAVDKAVASAIEKERVACADMVLLYIAQTTNMEARGCLASVTHDIRARGEA